MGSDLPKVLHELCGQPLVAYPIRAAATAGVETTVVVVGHGREQVQARVDGLPNPGTEIRYGVQEQQLGTGHAVLAGMPQVPTAADDVLILSGDVPLIRPETLRALIEARAASGEAAMSLATFRPRSPHGYGRIVRDASGAAVLIREQADASEAERAIGECNAGVYCVSATVLREQLPRIGSDNENGEIYLTDLLELQARRGPVGVVKVDPVEVAGVNTPTQLAELEAEARRRGIGQ